MLWTLWPTWVWFSVMATGNHYWLDIAAGVGVALVGGTIVAWAQERRLSPRPGALSLRLPTLVASAAS